MLENNAFRFEEADVPSPFGMYVDGEKVEQIGEPTLHTHFPGLVDPVTGYIMELNTDEEMGKLMDSDPFISVVFDIVNPEVLRRIMRVTERIVVEYIKELNEDNDHPLRNSGEGNTDE
jgi:hypothetical protein